MSKPDADPQQAAHLFASILFPIFCGTLIVYPLSAVPPSAQMALECLKYTRVTALTLVPPYVEEVGRNPEILEALAAKVDCIFWAGGDISLATGNAIAAKMKLFTTCGSTEMGMWPTIRPSVTLTLTLKSFSTVLREALLAVANDIASPVDGSSGILLYQPPSAAYQALNRGYSFMAFVAIILLEVGLSLVALHVGAHISISAPNWLPTLSPRLTKKIIDALIVIAAPTTWLATICLVVWLPYFGREDNTLSRQTWRGPALYAFGILPCRLCCQIDSTCRYA